MDHPAHELWQNLAAAALVGGERQAFQMPTVAGKLGAALAGVAARAPAPDQALLTAAGLVSVYRRAGLRLHTDGTPLPEPCPEDDQPQCSLRSSGHLAQMLVGPYSDVLSEWLAIMARVGRRVRHDDLVPLLEYGRLHRHLRAAIIAVLGRRGRWLAAHNREWSYAALQKNREEDWQTGSREWRLEELKRRRADDPVKARQLLESTWDQESPADRAAFLETLVINLGMGDEPFLESALDDRRVEVRRAAADLLSRLADSRLCQRMRARLEPLVRFVEVQGKLKVDLTLPDQHSKELARDGIAKTLPGMGEKTAWLKQMLAAVSPSHWCQVTGLLPIQLIETAERSEGNELLLRCWGEAACRLSDQDWLEAIVSHHRSRGFSDINQFNLICSSLPRALQEKLLVDILWSTPGVLPNPAVWLGQIGPPWSDELSHAVIEFVRREVHFTVLAGTILRLAAARMSPSCQEELAERFQVGADLGDPYRARAVDEALSLLRFRHEMILELQT